MKKIILLLFLTVCSVYGQKEADFLFEKGNNLYKDGDYKAAIEVYESILDNDYASMELYYNLGNAYYKLRDIGHAILYYERARNLVPNDPDVLHNLKLANLRVVDKIQSPPSFLYHSWLTIREAMTLDQIAILTLFLWMVSCIVVILRFLITHPAVQKWLRIVFSPLFIVFTVFLIYFITQLRYNASHEPAIVMPDKVEIKSSPAKDAQTVFALHEGVKVTITDKADLYYRIRLKDGKIGWLAESAVEKI